MELATCSLLCALFVSVSASPVDLRQRQDADIPDSDLTSDLDQDWMDTRFPYTGLGSSSESQSSSESSSESSEESSKESSEESSEEPAFTQPPHTEPPTSVPVAMTTAGEVTPGTDQPPVDSSTVPEPCPTGSCVTVDIPTSSPVTGSRGDN